LPPPGVDPRLLVVTGAQGLLGSAVAAQARRRGLEVRSLGRAEADLSQPGSFERQLARRPPLAVIHCAAWTDVDGCQRDPARAERDNAQAAGWVVEACRRLGSRLVAISTDAVFDGEASPPYAYSESDRPGPLSVYGRTKLEAERRALQWPEALVVRTNFLGPLGRGFGGWLYRALVEGRGITLFEDARFTPLYVSDLGERLVRLAIDHPAEQGVLHLGGAEAVSKAELGLALAHRLGLSTERIRRGRIADQVFDAPRPRNTALDSRRAAGLLGPLPSLDQTLEAFCRDVAHALACRGELQLAEGRR